MFFCRHGCPRSLHSDQGTHFESHFLSRRDYLMWYTAYRDHQSLSHGSFILNDWNRTRAVNSPVGWQTHRAGRKPTPWILHRREVPPVLRQPGPPVNKRYSFIAPSMIELTLYYTYFNIDTKDILSCLNDINSQRNSNKCRRWHHRYNILC